MIRMNLVCCHQFQFLKTHFNIIFPCTPQSPERSSFTVSRLKFCKHFSHILCVMRPSFCHPNAILWRIRFSWTWRRLVWKEFTNNLGERIASILTAEGLKSNSVPVLNYVSTMPMNTYEGVEVQIHDSWPRHYMEWVVSLFPRSLYFIWVWVSPRANLEAVE
jgi:hypothetical protein